MMSVNDFIECVRMQRGISTERRGAGVQHVHGLRVRYLHRCW